MPYPWKSHCIIYSSDRIVTSLLYVLNMYLYVDSFEVSRVYLKYQNKDGTLLCLGVNCL